VLGADTRATGGSIVVEKNCEKIHYIAPNIYCCGAGTAADTQFVTMFMSSNLELQRLNHGRETRVSSFVTMTSKTLYRYQGHLGAHLIVGGYDVLGPHLCMISGGGKYLLMKAIVIPTYRTQQWDQAHYKP
jgi:20S proteasome subunit beta 2